MAHMQNAGNIGRGNYNGVWLLFRLRLGVEKIILFPKFIPLAFGFLGIIFLLA